MNYRHIFHAGNFADVFKHSLLISLIDRLQIKDKPITFIDAHAGIGLYDLTADEVKRNPEYTQGIMQLLKQKSIPAECQHYVNLIKTWQNGEALSHYPGSPWLMRACLREQDELILNELHPKDYVSLRQNIRKQSNIHIHQRDAYEFLPAVLPPRSGRGIVLIDPPFEKPDEFKQLAQLMPKLQARFAHGCYLIWYPIKQSTPQKSVQAIIRATSMPCYSLSLRCKPAPTDDIDDSNDNALIGCGVLLFNPPWGIEQPWQAIKSTLERYLG